MEATATLTTPTAVRIVENGEPVIVITGARWASGPNTGEARKTGKIAATAAAAIVYCLPDGNWGVRGFRGDFRKAETEAAKLAKNGVVITAAAIEIKEG